MQKFQKGFGAVEAVIIIFVIAAIGLGAWYVFTQRDDNDSQQNTGVDTSNNSDQTAPAEDVDQEAQSWRLVESGQGGFGIRIPDGWEVTNYLPTNNIRSQDLNYQEGVPVKVTDYDHEYAGDSIFRFSVIQFGEDDNFSMLDGDEQKQDFKLGDITGTKYYKKYPVQKPQGIGPYPGMETYKYELKQGGVTTYVVYNIFNYNEYSKNILHNFTKSDPDQVELVDRVVRTLDIKDTSASATE